MSQKHSKFWLGLTLMAVALTTVGIGLARSRTIKSRGPMPVSPGGAQRNRQIADIESELITITPHGFEPQEIARPRGRFLLMIDNRSGLNDVALVLRREAGEQLREVHAPREQPNWSDVVDLEPGRYLLSESDHPRWQCLITITPR